MTTQDFLEQYAVLENHLFSLAPDFNKRRGLFNLLKHLKSINQLSDDLLKDISLIIQIRNEIMSTSTPSKDVSDDISGKITKVKTGLKM